MEKLILLCMMMVVIILNQTTVAPTCSRPCYSQNTNPCPDAEHVCLRNNLSTVPVGCEFLCINKTLVTTTGSDFTLHFEQCQKPCIQNDYLCTLDEKCVFENGCYTCKDRCNRAEVQCFAQPCSVDSAGLNCAKKIASTNGGAVTCIDNYCGGCKAEWYVDGIRVCQNSSSTCSPCPNLCADNTRFAVDRETGCDICECRPICPLYACFKYCPYGYKVDPVTGCKLCECNECPPKTLCKILCPYGFKLDPVTGCEICECNTEPCPAYMCPAFNCPYGFARDNKGCLTCQCRNCTEPSCPIACRNGYVKDQFGCPTCSCLPDCEILCPYGHYYALGVDISLSGCKCRCPQIYCFVGCENGYEVDKYGCQTCQCKPKYNNCSGIICDAMYCEFGYEVDSNGCPTCGCKPRPICPAFMCPTESMCIYGKIYDSNRCPTCNCEPCPQVKCARYCPFGYKRDNKTGCPTCLCNEQPICPLGRVEDTTFHCPILCGPKGYVPDENGCPTCRCNEVPPCKCENLPTDPPRFCPDGKTTSKYTGVCIRRDNTCYWEKIGCPICIGVTIPKDFNITEEVIARIRAAVNNINSVDVSVEIKNNNDGSKTYIICFTRDALTSDATANSVKGSVSSVLKDSNPNAVSYVYSDGTLSSYANIIVPLLGLYLVMLLL